MNTFQYGCVVASLHLLLIAISIAYSYAEGPASASATAEEVLAAYESGCATVRSFDVLAKVTTESEFERIAGKPPLTPRDRSPASVWEKVDHYVVGQVLSRQRYSEGRFRIDCTEIDGRTLAADSLVYAWNRDEFKKLSLGDRSGSVQSYARTQAGPHHLSYENLFLAFDGDYSLVSFIRDRRMSCERDGGCFVLTAHPAPKLKIRASRFGLRLHLDPARGFMPTRGAYLVDGENWPQSEWTNDLYEPTPGIWVPKIGAFRTILLDKNSPFAGTPLGKTTLEIDVSQARFNADIDPAVFNIDFPPGLTVLDKVNNRQYVSGPNGTAEHLMSLAGPARRAMDSLESKPVTLNRRWPILFSMNLLLVVAIVALLWWRRTVRTKAR